MQAIAAVAFGTETVPRCRKVVGPGNAYVSAAKRLLYGVLDVGLPAGPSEAIILADEETDPRIAALDLLIEAEHGPDSASLLVTHCQELADKIPALVGEFLKQLPKERRLYVEKVLNTYGGIILTENMEESILFINEYAPEHLEVLTREPFSILPRLKNAGEILLGPHTPITLCNFVLGPNAVLPTGSFAKTYSGVSVHDFLKRSSFAYVNRSGFDRIKKAALQIAEIEGFAAHAMAVRERDKLGG
jgi:histidinol dehydrogenase